MTQLAPAPRPSLATAPSQVAYGDILRVWRDADSLPQFEHAWLYDHLMPIFGDRRGPHFRGVDATVRRRRAAKEPRVRAAALAAAPCPGRSSGPRATPGQTRRPSCWPCGTRPGARC